MALDYNNSSNKDFMATYNGVSIVDYLNSLGQNSTITARANLAFQNGLVNSPQEYVTLAKQGLNGTINTQLLSKLQNPQQQNASSGGSQYGSNDGAAVDNGASGAVSDSNWAMQTNTAGAPVQPYQPVDLTNGGNQTVYHNDGIGIYRFTDADHTTLYLVDGVNHTIQPFQSESAVANYAPLGGMSPAELEGSNNIHEDTLQSLINSGYQYSSKAITNEGFDPLASQKTSSNDYLYGKGSISKDDFLQTFPVLAGYINLFQSSGAISPQTANNILNSPDMYSMYVGALVNGGYNPLDIFKDIKRQDLASQGDTQMANTTVISPVLSKAQFAGTSGGQLASSNPKLTPPDKLGTLDSQIMNLPISQIPKSSFSTIVQPLDSSTPAMQNEVNNIKSVIYDNSQQILNATTQQTHDQAVADWQRTKAIIERNTQMRLSNNAFDAYSQVSAMDKQAGANNIEGSGIEDEVRERYLNGIQRADALVRQNAKDTLTQQRIQTMLASGSPQDIAKNLTPAEIQQYGLAPSASDLQYYSLANLQNLYPTPAGKNPDEWNKYLQSIIDSVIDTSTGTPLYRSKLYSQLAQNSTTLNYGQTNVIGLLPYGAIGKYPSYQDTQKLSVEGSNTLAINKAEAPFTTSDRFSSPNPGDPTMPPETTAKTNSAASNLGGGTPQTPSSSQSPTSNTQMTTQVMPKTPAPAPTPDSSTNPNAASNGNSGSAYKGVSIVDYLGSTGQSNSFADRAKLATTNGINNYTGTADQNTQLLKQLRGF